MPRRSHTKSRKGCAKCKKRRIKCDEVHPSCGNCIKHGVECTFSQLEQLGKHAPPPAHVVDACSQNQLSCIITPAINIPAFEYNPASMVIQGTGNIHDQRYSDFRGHHHVHPHSSKFQYPDGFHLPSQHIYQLQQSYNSAFPPSNPGSSNSMSLDMSDLELFHHFTTKTYNTITTRVDFIELWRVVIPKLALSQPFLLHTILAVSALHLADLENGANKSRIYIAARHFEKVVAGIERVVGTMEHGSYSALFACATLVVVHSLATSQFHQKGMGRIHAPAMASMEWLPIARIVQRALDDSRGWVENSVVGAMLRVRTRYQQQASDRWNISLARLSSCACNFLKGLGLTGGAQTSSEPPPRATSSCACDTLDLFQLANPHSPSSPQRTELQDDLVASTYMTAIHEFKRCIDYDEEQSVIAGIYLWPLSLSESFLQFVYEERPRALVIVAYYCVLLVRARRLWWIGRSPMDEIERIAVVVGEEWSWWMEWPRAQARAKRL